MFYFDRFDICEAYYLYASLYHGGQFTKLYEVFGRLDNLKFRPSPVLRLSSLTENGRSIYDSLVERKHLQ